jgi:hypothetical protein
MYHYLRAANTVRCCLCATSWVEFNPRVLCSFNSLSFICLKTNRWMLCAVLPPYDLHIPRLSAFLQAPSSSPASPTTPAVPGAIVSPTTPGGTALAVSVTGIYLSHLCAIQAQQGSKRKTEFNFENSPYSSIVILVVARSNPDTHSYTVPLHHPPPPLSCCSNPYMEAGESILEQGTVYPAKLARILAPCSPPAPFPPPSHLGYDNCLTLQVLTDFLLRCSLHRPCPPAALGSTMSPSKPATRRVP